MQNLNWISKNKIRIGSVHGSKIAAVSAFTVFSELVNGLHWLESGRLYGGIVCKEQ